MAEKQNARNEAVVSGDAKMPLVPIISAIIFALTFTLFAYGSDIETVKIGEQVWMKRNLDVVPSGKNNAATAFAAMGFFYLTSCSKPSTLL